MAASDQHPSQLLMASEVPVGLEVAADDGDSCTPSGGMDATDGNWVYSAHRVDGPEEPAGQNGEARRHVQPSRTLLEAVAAMSSRDAGQRSGLPHFNRSIISRETVTASEQPPIPEAPPPGVPREAELPLRGPAEPVLSAEPSSPLSAATEGLDAPASPADAPFAFIRDIRPSFLDKPRIKLQHRIGAALFHSAHRHGVTERVGAKSGGSERRKVAIELVRYLASDAPQSGQIKRWKAHAICTRSCKDAHEAPQRQSAPTTSAQGDQAAADEMSVQGATSRGLKDKEFYLLAIPKSEIAKLQVSQETQATVTLACPRMSRYAFLLCVIQLSAGDQLMFRQRVESNAATEDGVQMMVYSAAAARYMDSTSLASSFTGFAAAAASSISGRHQEQQIVEVQNTCRLESGLSLRGQRGKKRSREHLESDQDYSVPAASIPTASVHRSADRCDVETVRGFGQRKQELEDNSGILLNASELAAVASLHRVIGGSFKDRWETDSYECYRTNLDLLSRIAAPSLCHDCNANPMQSQCSNMIDFCLEQAPFCCSRGVRESNLCPVNRSAGRQTDDSCLRSIERQHFGHGDGHGCQSRACQNCRAPCGRCAIRELDYVACQEGCKETAADEWRSATAETRR